MTTQWTLACAAVIGAVARTAGAQEPPAPLPAPNPPVTMGALAPDPPAGAARVALGLLDPLRTSRLDVTASGPRSNTDIDPGTANVAFAFLPRWSFVNTGTDWAWAGARVAWQVSSLLGSVEGGNPVTVRVDDVELDAAYSRTLVRDTRGDQLLLGPRVGLAFPSSYASRIDGIVLRTSLGLGIDLHVPLLHGDGLRGVLFSGNVTWESEIARSGQGQGLTPTAPVSLGISLLDQNHFFSVPSLPGGGGQVEATLGAWLTLYRDLSLGNTWGFASQYYPGIGCTSGLQGTGSAFGMPGSTSCPPTTNQPQPQLWSTIFDVALGYAVADVVWIAVGYDNTVELAHGTGAFVLTPWIGPGALFYGQVSLLFDGVYEKARGVPAPAPSP